MAVETRIYHDDKCVKVVRIFNDKRGTLVQEVELRKQGDKEVFIPTYMHEFIHFEDARAAWLGRIAMASYEVGNPTQAPIGNIFRNNLNGKAY